MYEGKEKEIIGEGVGEGGRRLTGIEWFFYICVSNSVVVAFR